MTESESAITGSTNTSSESPHQQELEEITQYSILKKMTGALESYPAIIYKSRYISFYNLLTSIVFIPSVTVSVGPFRTVVNP